MPEISKKDWDNFFKGKTQDEVIKLIVDNAFGEGYYEKLEAEVLDELRKIPYKKHGLSFKEDN